jgi:Cu/Ag efflux protein CusF
MLAEPDQIVVSSVTVEGDRESVNKDTNSTDEELSTTFHNVKKVCNDETKITLSHGSITSDPQSPVTGLFSSKTTSKYASRAKEKV